MDPIIKSLHKKAHVLFPETKDITDVYHEFIKYNYFLKELNIDRIDRISSYPNLKEFLSFFKDASPNYVTINSFIDTNNKKLRKYPGEFEISFLVDQGEGYNKLDFDNKLKFEVLLLRPLTNMKYMQKIDGIEQPHQIDKSEYLFPLFLLEYSIISPENNLITVGDEKAWGHTSIYRG